jgi:hypothetical protein
MELMTRKLSGIGEASKVSAARKTLWDVLALKYGMGEGQGRGWFFHP